MAKFVRLLELVVKHIVPVVRTVGQDSEPICDRVSQGYRKQALMYETKPYRPARSRRLGIARATWFACCALLLPLTTRALSPHDIPRPVRQETGEKSTVPLRVLIVGGGPSLEYNQVAIESNVRYVARLLPSDAIRTTLFADGNANKATVLYDDDPRAMPTGERVIRLLLGGRDSESYSPAHYRKPNLGSSLDGASKYSELDRVFTQIAGEESKEVSPEPLLLYFTGHGSHNEKEPDNNRYDLWGGGRDLTVRDLAQHIARLPQNVPVTLVMVQCFSGAFGNLIFEGGNQDGHSTDRDIAGFFATVEDRVAAGCTSAINEAEYHDFTSYFFAALTGIDRVGRHVSGADYNHDGRVGMDEAFCYSLIHDESIDVPVCTSDVFLQRYLPMSMSQEAALFRTPYKSLIAWATPAQRAALDGLSGRLHLAGTDRPNLAYQQFQGRIGSRSFRAHRSDGTAARRYAALRSEGSVLLKQRFPSLRISNLELGGADVKTAVAEFTKQADAGEWKDLLDADDALDKADSDAEDSAIADSQLIRFVRLCKSVMLAHRLRESGDKSVQVRFKRLLEAEGRTLLPPANQQPASRIVSPATQNVSQ